MKSTFAMLALAALATVLAVGPTTAPADAKGFANSGRTPSRNFGGHRHHGIRFGFGHANCWRFGKWICGPGS